MNGRDVLHRLVDDLEDDDAVLLTSIVDAGDGGVAWSKQAQDVLREWLDNLDRRRLAVLSLALLTQPPHEVSDQITSALASWRADQVDADQSDAAQARRERVVADAVGSVRLEGLEPSDEAHRSAAEYVAGAISADELYAEALRRVRTPAGK